MTCFAAACPATSSIASFTARRAGRPVRRLSSASLPSSRESVRRSARQRRQPPALIDDALAEAQRRVTIVESAVAERLGVALDRRERRAQLVRDVGDEVAPHAIQLLGLGDVAHHDDGALLRAEGRSGERQRATNRLHALEVQAALGALALPSTCWMRSTNRGSRARSRTSPGRSVRRDAEDLAEGGVQEPDPAAGVGHQHALGHAGDGGAQVIALGLDRADLLAGVTRDALQGVCRGGRARAARECGRRPRSRRAHAVGRADELAERPEKGAREPPRDQGDQRQRGEPGEQQDPGEMAIQGGDRGERLAETQDPRAAAAVVDEAGGVEGVVAGGVAVADGTALAAGEGCDDLRSGEVVVHRRELVVAAVAVGEHGAVDGDDRDAEIGPVDELPQRGARGRGREQEGGRCRHRRDEESGSLGRAGRSRARRASAAAGSTPGPPPARARREPARAARGGVWGRKSRPWMGGSAVYNGGESASAGLRGVLRKGGGKGCGKVSLERAGERSLPAFFSVLHCFLCS